MPGPGLNRRDMLVLTGGAVLGSVLLPPRLRAAEGALAGAMAESDLVYITPLKSDGSESRCQAEVWFVADAGNAVVVTASDAWRARAVQSGLDQAHIWVGDVGVWSDSDGAYRELPGATASASLVEDPAEHKRLLEKFGDKYSLEWVLWGPRFRNGLADGSRVMLRYAPA